MLVNFQQRLAIIETQIDTPEGRAQLLAKSLPEKREGAEILLNRYAHSDAEDEKQWIKLVLIGAVGLLLDKKMTVGELYNELHTITDRN